jgi:hypothetical protein
MAIVGDRVTVVNDASSFCAIVAGLGDDELAIMDQIDRARDRGESLARAAWDAGGGRCAEHGDLMTYLLREAGERAIVLSSTAGHAFPLVNYADGFDPDNPWTWGPHAFIADTWLENAWGHVGFIDDPEDAWDDNWIFADGTKDVSSGNEPLSTRQYMRVFMERGRAFIESRCEKYRPVLTSYLRYPADIQAEIGLNPPQDVCLETGPAPVATAEPEVPPAREGFVTCPAPPRGFELRASQGFGEPNREPGEITVDDTGFEKRANADCLYGVAGRQQGGFSVRVHWLERPSSDGSQYCKGAPGEPLLQSRDVWSLSFSGTTTEEWRGPYSDRMSLGISFALVYSSHQRLAYVHMSEYEEGTFRDYAYSDWREAAATHLLRSVASHAWQCPG